MLSASASQARPKIMLRSRSLAGIPTRPEPLTNYAVLDQGAAATLHRWPGVRAGLGLRGRPARRTPGPQAGSADKNRSCATRRRGAQGVQHGGPGSGAAGAGAGGAVP